MESKKKPIIIDAEGCIAGRIASFAAKKAIQGEKIIILNSEKAVIIGNREVSLARYKDKFSLGTGVQKGPLFHKIAEKLMRRIVRGMLPWKRTKGREAYRNVICLRGVPEKYAAQEKITIAKADAINFISLYEICKLVGKDKK